MKKFIKSLIIIFNIVAAQQCFAMDIYTVKSNDYLYKIIKAYTIKGVSNSDMIDAIKGINKSENPDIVDNTIKVGEKLAIPTTKSEVKDGISLYQEKMSENFDDTKSYNKNTSKVKNNQSDNHQTIKTDSKKPTLLISQANVNQKDVPDLIPKNSPTVTYKNDINSKIKPTNIQEDEHSSGSLIGSIVKIIILLAIFVAIFIFGRRYLQNKMFIKEQEDEIKAKKKREHLMSRISPVVSDTDFYKSSDKKAQTEFDFFAESNRGEYRPASSLRKEFNQQETHKETDNNHSDNFNDEENLYGEVDKNIAVRTDKGVVFETNTNNVSDDHEVNLVEEKNLQEDCEQESKHMEELIEQYLESEKYMEAIIIIQDSLEKNPNNIDLRYKLLEIYARSGENIAFDGEVHFIRSKNIVTMFDPLHQKIAKLRDKYFDQ